MLVVGLALAGGAALLIIGRRAPQVEAESGDQTADGAAGEDRSGAGSPDPSSESRRHAVMAESTERLWRHVFETGAVREELPPAHQSVRAVVLETLEVESLGDRYFPRRPTLMPQLLHAVNDPDAGPARLAAIVSQDPVLTGDVVRLANSAFYRVTPNPVETIQRAIVVCGSDGLQSLIATALMQPVFRGTHGPFGRFPTALWERTSQAATASETYAQLVRRGDRLLAQLASLLGALGPLVIYRAAIEAYAQAPKLKPHAELFLGLIETAGAQTSRRIADQWKLPERVVAALGVQAGDTAEPDAQPLAEAVEWGELLGTLSALEFEHVIDREEAARIALGVDLSAEHFGEIWKRMRSARR